MLDSDFKTDSTKLNVLKESYSGSDSGESFCSNRCRSCDGDGWVMPPGPVWVAQIPEDQITREIAEVAVKYNAIYLRFVPKKFVDRDLVELTLKEGRYVHGRQTLHKIFHLIPEDLRTETMYHSIAFYKPKTIKKMPKEYLKSDFVKRILKKIPMCVQYFDADMLEDDAYKYAIQKGVKISCIPEKRRTLEMYLLALKNSPEEMKYVPEEMKDDKMIRTAINYHEKWYPILEHIPNPEAYLDLDNLYEIVKSGGILNIPVKMITRDLAEKHLEASINYYDETVLKGWLDPIPNKFKTRPYLLEAVKKVGSYLKYVDPELIDDDFYIASISNLGSSGFSYIPPEKLTIPICMVAMEKGHVHLSKIPIQCRSRPICLMGINSEYGLETDLKLVPDIFKDKEFWEHVAEKTRRVDLIPDEFMNMGMCLSAFNGIKFFDNFSQPDIDNLFRRIPKQYLNGGFYYKLSKLKPELFPKFPDEFLTFEMCVNYMVASHNASTYYIPKRFLKEDLFIEFLKRTSYVSAGNMEKIPRDKLTLNICKVAIERCSRYSLGEILDCIPDKFMKDLQESIDKVNTGTLYLGIGLNAGTMLS